MINDFLIKYVNKWIALSTDRKKVIASAENIKDLDKKIKALKNPPNVIYHRVLPIDGSYAP